MESLVYEDSPLADYLEGTNAITADYSNGRGRQLINQNIQGKVNAIKTGRHRKSVSMETIHRTSHRQECHHYMIAYGINSPILSIRVHFKRRDPGLLTGFIARARYAIWCRSSVHFRAGF